MMGTRPAETLGVVGALLAPGGGLYLFNQAPGWQGAGAAREFADRLTGVLGEHRFLVDEVRIADLRRAPAMCVIARAS
jgi:hypothetical protein